mmetsp:Transcript_58143/g.182146  ORF Transcript_58143/g.182146 Transcript_58143/m.182146 type:complete len:223 (-) Transcript_58143:145-813(-)
MRHSPVRPEQDQSAGQRLHDLPLLAVTGVQDDELTAISRAPTIVEVHQAGEEPRAAQRVLAVVVDVLDVARPAPRVTGHHGLRSPCDLLELRDVRLQLRDEGTKLEEVGLQHPPMWPALHVGVEPPDDIAAGGPVDVLGGLGQIHLAVHQAGSLQPAGLVRILDLGLQCLGLFLCEEAIQDAVALALQLAGDDLHGVVHEPPPLSPVHSGVVPPQGLAARRE